MVSKLRDWLTPITTSTAKVLVALGITANMVTIAGFAINVITGLCFAYGRLILAGILIIFGGSFDMLDGAVARVRQVNDSSGALLDSIVDRYSEGAIFLGLAVYFHQYDKLYGTLGILFTFSSMVGSFLVSYARARAEGLAVECKVGLMQRTERLVFLSAGTIIQGILANTVPNGLILIIVLAILMIATNITAIHRLLHSFHRLRNLSH
ncbi:MAG: CDP-alcohol phosphatidyltransferase family protein [Deltaproteobacteria bacterium]|nr:CDP-alcohol phosphatidyltransferase family protein [Deltaproteobacteria bacterium]